MWLDFLSFNINFFLAVLVGALNDRLLLANPTDINPRQKKKTEIKSCLVGLLEPLLLGFATMQQHFEQKLDLPEILYQITSRFLLSDFRNALVEYSSLLSSELLILHIDYWIDFTFYHMQKFNIIQLLRPVIDVFSELSDWRFDSLRITPRSLDILSRGSPVCGDLAVSLSQSGPQFTPVLHGWILLCLLLT